MTRKAVERTLDALRPELETSLRSLAEEVARVVAEERKGVAVREITAALDAAHKVADAKLADMKEQLGARIASLERQLVQVREAAEAEARANQFEAEKEHRAQLASLVERAQTGSGRSALASAARLVESIRSLDEAESLGHALLRLGEGARREADRVAVLVVKNRRLQGWAFLGFGGAVAAPGEVTLDPDDRGLLGEVSRTGAPASSHAGEFAGRTALALPSFAGSGAGRHALALPVLVGGTVVAVLYADATRSDLPSAESGWPAMLEVLVRHASRVLEAMMVAQASGVSIPRPVAR